VTPDRRTFLAALAGAIAAPAIIGRASAATPLVIASLLGEDKPETRIWTHIRDRVEQELPGAFTFNIVPNAALGGEKEVVEGMQLGSIQASLATLSSLSAWTPECQLFDMPFLFRDAMHLHAALQSEYGGELRNRLGEQGLVMPAFINYGARHLLTRAPLTTADELQAKRIRVIQSPLHAQLWESFGALPIALPITETYNALSTGHVHAMDLTISAYAGFRLYEVAPHVIETGHIHAGGGVIFSGPFWSRLSAEQQAALEKAAVDGARYFNELMAADERASVEVAAAGGATFQPISGRDEWEKPARAVWESFAPQVGGMDRILAIVELNE